MLQKIRYFYFPTFRSDIALRHRNESANIVFNHKALSGNFLGVRAPDNSLGKLKLMELDTDGENDRTTLEATHEVFCARNVRQS